MTTPSIFGRHKYDTKDQLDTEVGFLFVLLIFCGIFAFLFLFQWNSSNMHEICKSQGGEMLVVNDGGRYSATHCVKNGKIVKVFK